MKYFDLPLSEVNRLESPTILSLNHRRSPTHKDLKANHDLYQQQNSNESSKKLNKISVLEKLNKFKTTSQKNTNKFPNFFGEISNEKKKKPLNFSNFSIDNSKTKPPSNNSFCSFFQPNNENNYDESRNLRRLERICDSDTEDDESDGENQSNWVISHENSYKRIFDIFISLIIIYSSIILPYQFSFVDKKSLYDEIIEYIFIIFLTADIILNFFSAYIDQNDNIIKDHKLIIKNYLKSWFIIDFISAFPFTFFFQNNKFNPYNIIARLIRLPRIYRLIHLFKGLRMVKILKEHHTNKVAKFFLDLVKISPNIERLIYFICAFLLLNHIAACIWYYVAKSQNFRPDCWVSRLGYIDESNSEIYIISFYWTLTTVTTVGYGDISAGTSAERIYNIFLMCFGVIMYSFAIGSLSSIVSTLDSRTAEMNQKLHILSSIKREFNLDQEIYDKVRKVIKYDLSRNQKDKMNFLQELPNKLRIELSQKMHDNVIQKIYFFKGQPSDFIAYVAPLLKPVKFSQNDDLYKINDIIDEMYFISKGTIIFCLSQEYNEKEIKEVKKHNNFGEIEMCLNEKITYNIKVKSRSSELFVLKKNDFLKLSVNFKDFIEKFLQKSLLVYLRFTEEKAKIIAQIEELQQIQNQIKGINPNNQNKLEKIDEKEESSFNEEDILASDDSCELSSEEDSKSYEEEESEEDSDESEGKVKEDSDSEISENSKSNQKKSDENQNENGIIIKTMNTNQTIAEENSSFRSSVTGTANNTSINQINTKNFKLPSSPNVGSGNRRGTVNPLLFQSKLGIGDITPNDKLKKIHTTTLPEENTSTSKKTDDKEKNEDSKNQLNVKFVKKVNKLLEFISRNQAIIGKEEDGFVELLNKLIGTSNLSERNEIIEKLESIVASAFKDN